MDTWFPRPLCVFTCIVTGYVKLMAMVGRTGGKDRQGPQVEECGQSLHTCESAHIPGWTLMSTLLFLVSLPLIPLDSLPSLPQYAGSYGSFLVFCLCFLGISISPSTMATLMY